MSRNNPLRIITELRITSSVETASPVGRGKSNGLILAFEAREMLIYVPPTASERCLYSISGSITITSVPSISDRIISSLTAYDLPAPDVAKITAFAFCKEKRSKIINELLCRLTTYKTPLSLVNSAEVNGKLEAIGEVL